MVALWLSAFLVGTCDHLVMQSRLEKEIRICQIEVNALENIVSECAANRQPLNMCLVP